jgi:hypothetical protein
MLPIQKLVKYRPSASVTDTLVKVALVGTGLYFLNKAYRNYQKSQTEAEADSNPAVQQAMALRVAMNPSGLEWLRRVDGTDLTGIFTTALKITSIQAVASAYKNLYQSSLFDDLQTELSASEYQKLLTIVKYSGNQSIQIPVGNFAVTKLAANARKTPKVLGKFSFDNNIIKQVNTNTFIGFTTGKKAFDAESNTAFIELKTFNGKKFFYVALSQVDLYSKSDFEAKYGKNYGGMIETFSNVSFSGFINSPNKPNSVVMKIKAPIYNLKGEAIGWPDAGTLLGKSIMEIKGKDQRCFIQFKNSCGQLGLVDRRFVQI